MHFNVIYFQKLYNPLQQHVPEQGATTRRVVSSFMFEYLFQKKNIYICIALQTKEHGEALT